MSAIIDQGTARAAWTAEARHMLALGWPLILTNLAQTGMTTTDVLMMGRLGAEAVAAGALGANLYFGFIIFGIGVMSAVSPLIAAARGRDPADVDTVRRTVRAGLWAALAIALPFWLVMWNGEAILRALGQDPHLAALAGGYLRVLQWSALPFFAYLVLRSFMAALERPRWSLVAVVIGLVANAGLNWLFVFGHWGFPAMGLPGSGLATALSTTLMAGILVVVAARDRPFARFRPFAGLWRPDRASFRAVWRIGLPIGAMLAFEVTIFNAAVFLMGLIGPAPLAAHAIAIQIASLAFMIPLGLGQAATVRVGHAYGAGDRDAVARAGWTAYGMGVGTMLMTATLLVLFPRALIGAFLDIHDPANAAVVAQAVVFLGIAALFQIVDGAQAVASGMLRGLHDTRVPMVYAALGYWGLGLPLGIVLAFPAGLGGAGIWTGLASALAVVAALMTWRWIQRDRLGLMRGR